MTDMKKVLQKLDGMEKGFNDRQGTLENRLDQMESGFNDKLEAMENRFNKRFDNVEKDIKVLKSDMGEVKSDVSSLKTDVSSLKTGQANILKQVAHNTEAIYSIKEDVSKLHSDSAYMSFSVQQLSRKTGEHDIEIEVLKEQVNS